jgi:hypothetical protein
VQNYCISTLFGFHPLLTHPITLAGLKNLVLSNFTSAIALTDMDILTLARTCPHLTVLDLGCTTPISLYALGFLAPIDDARPDEVYPKVPACDSTAD